MKRIILNIFLIASFIVYGSSYGQSFSTGVVDLNMNIGSTVQLDIDTVTGLVTMTLIGPDDRWLGLGFGVSTMSPGADVVYVNNGNLVDATMNFHAAPTTDAISDWTVISNTTASGIRTLIATRAIDSGSGDFVFPDSEQSIMLVYANGSAPGATTIAYHGNSGSGNIGATVTNLKLGTEDLAFDSAGNFKAYPNPIMDSVLHIELPKSFESGIATIYNAVGQKILESKIDSFTQSVDVADVSNGMYLLELVNQDGNRISKRIIKQ